MLRSLLFKKLEQKEQDMINHYKYLHQYPEPSFNEAKTSQYIESFIMTKMLSYINVLVEIMD